MQCLDGLKHLCAKMVCCCDAGDQIQPKGLENPEALARETVCISSSLLNFSLISKTIT